MQFLEKVVDVPFECNVRCLVETVQKTVEVLQLALIDKVDDVPCAGRRPGLANSGSPQIQFIADLQTFQFATETGTHSETVQLSAWLPDMAGRRR